LSRILSISYRTVAQSLGFCIRSRWQLPTYPFSKLLRNEPVGVEKAFSTLLHINFLAVSISVSIWTLVAISMERYFAICRPLTSRRWQTRNHASKMISFVWTASLICSIPILLVQQLQPIPTGTRYLLAFEIISFSIGFSVGHKCREQWPSNGSEQMYNLFLNVILFLLPLTVMSSAYFMIVDKLWKGLQREMEHSSCQKLGNYF